MTISHQQEQHQHHISNIAHQKNTDATIKNIETQLGQMANMQRGICTANTQTNPKGHCNSMSTRSGKVIGKSIGDNLETERVVVESKEKQEGEKEESEKELEEKNKEEEENVEVFENNVEKVIEENEGLEKVVVEEQDQNEGEEKLGEKEEENNQEGVKVNKAEIDEVVESICALFNKQLRRRTWTPHHLYFKFMEFLPNKLKSKDDVLSVSFWPP
ncbi:hypothetical protein QL285_051383 [Trifolium repens]|nr:hypothetical protein QL285_051383 [Trifolium repens]